MVQLWWQFFQISVYGDVVYAQTWEVLTLKYCIDLERDRIRAKKFEAARIEFLSDVLVAIAAAVAY